MALAISFVGDAPPSEFRIFAAGENATTKGVFVFDQQAAADVMAAYQRHGNDVMIDLEHLSLEDTVQSRNFDPDARGWCRLELRGGELWATGVTWTPDGEARLRDKRQRYVSPAFDVDPDTRRITRILNIAITALPATDHTPALVAASLIGAEGENTMSPEQFAQIAEALGLGADANVEDVVATISAMVKKITDAANGDGDPEDKAEAPEGPPAAAATAEATPPVVAASKVRSATRALARLSGKKDLGEIVHEVEAWRKSHMDLETQREKLAKEKATLEGGERRRLVGDLVKLGAEIPATAWADDDGTKPAEPWASMPMDQLRTRVAKLAKAKGVTTTATTEPKPKPIADSNGGTTVTVNGQTVQLSATEVTACKEANAKIEDYAANKLIRLRAQGASA